MPRSLSTCASFFRSLLHKTQLMGVETESSVVEPQSLGDVRKKWHISPAFNVEFISYYLDRTSRLQEMKSRLTFLLQENDDLMKEEARLRSRYNSLSSEAQAVEADNTALLNKALEMHDLLKGLAGRPLRLPPVVAALHNPPFVDVQPAILDGSAGGVGGYKEKRLITKAATKMMGGSLPAMPVGLENDGSFRPLEKGFGVDSAGVMSIHPCSVCQSTKEQHMLIQCDTCSHYYHLSCLDPPLSRMPKKTKQMGWQCSDCCKSSDSDKAPEIDTAAPRRLRRVIKEPSKFSPSIAKDQKTPHDRRPDIYLKAYASSSLTGLMKGGRGPSKSTSSKTGVKRRLSGDGKRGKQKVRRRSLDTPRKGMSCSSPPTVPTGVPSASTSSSVPSSSSSSSSSSAAGPPLGGASLDISADSLPSPHSESFPSEEDPLCSSRRERRHREGGKKKKKDREKEEGGRKRKKHHRERHPVGEMASEMVSPFRIKIKPLPPRPNGLENMSAPSPVPARTQTSDVVASHTTPTTTAPPGYPPLPPGYTLTQPMLLAWNPPPNPSQESAIGTGSRTQTSNSTNASTLTTTATTTTTSIASTVTTTANSSTTAPPTVGGRMSIGRRKSDPAGGAEQFSKCDVCGETGGVTNTVMCDECLKAYHFNCLEPPLKKSPKRRGYSWFCEDCDNASERN